MKYIEIYGHGRIVTNCNIYIENVYDSGRTVIGFHGESTIDLYGHGREYLWSIQILNSTATAMV
jgi:hypothetical protein